MIINAYSVLDGFLAILRLPLSLVILGLALQAWRQRQGSDLEHRESRYYLLVLLAALLAGLNVVGWPLFYALLQSYVAQWPGVMCMYGVTRIGLGSDGASRYLPGLITSLQVGKPLVVFCSGAWFVLYLANRETKKSPLMSGTLGLIMLFAVVSFADAALESTYLLIPKSEKFLAVGCCAVAVSDLDRAARFVPTAMLGTTGRQLLRVAYFAINILLPLGLAMVRFRVRGRWLLAPLLAALVAFPISLLFLIEIAAPTILRLPYHHCPYDLLATAPETAIGIGSFLLGIFAIGWACLVDTLGRRALEPKQLERATERLLFVAAVAFAASLVLFAMELKLA